LSSAEQKAKVHDGHTRLGVQGMLKCMFLCKLCKSVLLGYM